MKSFAFFMSIYLLLLCCLPCSDNTECTVQESYTTSQTDKHDDHSHESENCTPFCTCSCCAVMAFVQPLIHFNPQAKNYNSVKYPEYQFIYLSGIPHFIWQPPQLG